MMGSELLSSPSSIKESSSKASTQPAANSSEQGYTHPRIAALIPCYNEELTVGKVIDDFHKYLPEATVYVYDNNSSDNTAEIARQHKAIVRFESRQGKGNVVRQMLRDIDADYYIMVDGDDTYPIEQANELLAPLFVNEADHVVGDRLSNSDRRPRRSFFKARREDRADVCHCEYHLRQVRFLKIHLRAPRPSR
jgi:cellulose synthase/poly-beta-1,6-N-acetylglucosamine synthase-like glycosyltransferase